VVILFLVAADAGVGKNLHPLWAGQKPHEQLHGGGADPPGASSFHPLLRISDFLFLRISGFGLLVF
jgi:hypothetical protein